MKLLISTFLTLVCLAFGTTEVWAQQPQSARSNKIYLYYGYPELILSNDIAFSDGNRNGTLESGEEGIFIFLLENKAQYVASDVVVRPRVISSIQGLEFPAEVSLGDIPANGSKEVKISVKGGENLTSGSASLTFYIDESGEVARTISYAVDTQGR